MPSISLGNIVTVFHNVLGAGVVEPGSAVYSSTSPHASSRGADSAAGTPPKDAVRPGSGLYTHLDPASRSPSRPAVDSENTYSTLHSVGVATPVSENTYSTLSKVRGVEGGPATPSPFTSE